MTSIEDQKIKLSNFESSVDCQLLEDIEDGRFGLVYNARHVQSGHLAGAKAIEVLHEMTIEEWMKKSKYWKTLSNQTNAAQYIEAFIFSRSWSREDHL